VQINTLIGAGSLPGSPLDWNTLISDEAIINVIQSKRWLSPNVTTKYQSLVEKSLSYSQSISGTTLDNPPMLSK
jgi:hypothetical protein